MGAHGCWLCLEIRVSRQVFIYFSLRLQQQLPTRRGSLSSRCTQRSDCDEKEKIGLKVRRALCISNIKSLCGYRGLGLFLCLDRVGIAFSRETSMSVMRMKLCIYDSFLSSYYNLVIPLDKARDFSQLALNYSAPRNPVSADLIHG